MAMDAKIWFVGLAVACACSKDKTADEPAPGSGSASASASASGVVTAAPKAAVVIDAGVAIDAAIAPDAAPPATDVPPAGITPAQLKQLDAEIAALESLSKDVAAATDCKKAAAALLKHWKGFKPVKVLLREINAKHDPAIDHWFEFEYMKRVLVALSGVLNRECDEGSAWDLALDKVDFVGMRTK
jgi:hypothetical protein